MPYWFNVDTKTVESDDQRSRDAELLGPYDTREEAQNALHHAADNTARWEDEEAREREEKEQDIEQHGSINPFDTMG